MSADSASRAPERPAWSASSEVRPRRGSRSPPAYDRLCGPGAGSVRVAAGAGARRARLLGEIGPRNAERVVVTLVDLHVRTDRRVTRDAARRGGSGRVVVMRRRVEDLRRMAAAAQCVALLVEPQAVGVVAVATRDARGVHAALEERAVLEDLVLDLSVGEVEVFLEERHAVGVEDGPAMDVVLAQHRAPAVTAGAGLDLRLRRPGHAAACDGLALPAHPRGAVAGADPESEPHRGIDVPLPAGSTQALGPRHVRRSRPMTRLAPDVFLGERRRVALGRGVPALPCLGGVTLGALVVPVARDVGPVERIVGSKRLFRPEVEPALASVACRSRIPCPRERLLSPSRKRNQVLLQRIDAEGVGDFELSEGSVHAIRSDDEATVLAEEERLDAEVRQGARVEPSEHRVLGRRLKGQIVMGAPPALGFLRMARRAGRTPYEGSLDRRHGRPLCDFFPPASCLCRECSESAAEGDPPPNGTPQ